MLSFYTAIHHRDNTILQKTRLGSGNWIGTDHHAGDVYNVPKHFTVPAANCISEIHWCMAHVLLDGSFLCICGPSVTEDWNDQWQESRRK